jgi:hypothetical protein
MYNVCAVAIVLRGLPHQLNTLGMSWVTHNPHRTPTESMKLQACCLPRSSLDTLSFPLCFADNFSTSPGVKYGLYSMTFGVVDDSGILGVMLQLNY